MRTVTSLPHPVKEEEHCWIPLSDGTRLAARIWRPVTSENDPVPAILEYIPYRKRDLTARRDSIHHPYLAGHGYASVRVDLRGSGDSEGVLTDEYLELELADGEEVLDWIAGQDWCNGRTGMMGISWGGFNALQLAARKPASLAAIATVCSSDDRYADDVHYMGGCLLSDNLSWASTMFAYTSCPPDPAIVGDRWREMWHERLNRSGLWLAEWLRHQRRDDYWRHGSVCEDFSAIDIPVLAVSGWADGYSNSVFRLLESLNAPKQGLVGPWSHKYPHLGVPGPAIGFLQELVRWWDHWLGGIDNDIMDEPTLRIWMQDSVKPSTSYERRPGRWVGEPSWPSPNVRPTRLTLGENSICLYDEEAEEQELTVSSPLSVGQFAGKWCSYNAPPDLPYDQREEDGGSLVFDTDVLDQHHEILGAPVVNLDVAADAEDAMIAVRLSDIHPDGKGTRVTYGLLNLTHRDSHAEPEPLVPGQRYSISVKLNSAAQVFPPGHKMRVSISTSYWPLAWPPPKPVKLSVFSGTSELVLPIRPQQKPDELRPAPFGEAEGAPPLSTPQIRPGEQRWDISRDLVEYESALNVVKDLGEVRFEDIGLDVTRRADERYRWVAEDFESPCGEVDWHIGFTRGTWQVDTRTHTSLSCTETEFVLHARLDAYEGDERVFSRNWHTAIPRDHV